jgi:hypothetical protein
MARKSVPQILDCGHPPSPHSEFTTGYGRDENERTFCYECCANRDRETMTADGRYTLYLVGNGTCESPREVTNWPGSLRFPVHHFHSGRHNIARHRYDVWFTGPDGENWHGIQYGDNTQICHVRRVKG